jgi:regulator of RNase E activity RraA
MDPEIQSRTGLKVCGVAVTVMTRSGDNLMVHKAIEVAAPGDIIVVNTGGDKSNAVFGELIARSAIAVQLGGFVIDGGIRDIEALVSLGFPVFSRAVSSGGCDKDGPGEVNVPIVCGNAVVMPGDIVVGDACGVVVIPRVDAPEVLKLVNALKEREIRRILEIESGQLFSRDIDETLRPKGVIR